MAKKRVPVEDDPETVEDESVGGTAEVEVEVADEEPAVEEVDLDLIGVSFGVGNEYSMTTVPKGFGVRDRRIRIGNVNLEHVDEDQHGRWLYRAM